MPLCSAWTHHFDIDACHKNSDESVCTTTIILSVFGWVEESFSGIEQGLGHEVQVAYQKGNMTELNFKVVTSSAGSTSKDRVQELGCAVHVPEHVYVHLQEVQGLISL